MDAVAYTNSAVISFITDNLIPLRIMANDQVLGSQFKIKWTPSLHVLDFDGIEHYRTLGFYPPEDLIPSLLLGMGKSFFNHANRQAACSCFNRIITEHPKNSLAPEAVYLNGVASFIENHDVSHLIALYDRLASDYPDSPWLTRADPYKLLKKSG
ncbi:MAG: tetratricopeptide repeat protein [Syntrophales bacterium]|nr:tetratricopeptide repeat protein [Syntrophales bacterium]